LPLAKAAENRLTDWTDGDLEFYSESSRSEFQVAEFTNCLVQHSTTGEPQMHEDDLESRLFRTTSESAGVCLMQLRPVYSSVSRA